MTRRDALIRMGIGAGAVLLGLAPKPKTMHLRFNHNERRFVTWGQTVYLNPPDDIILFGDGRPPFIPLGVLKS